MRVKVIATTEQLSCIYVPPDFMNKIFILDEDEYNDFCMNTTVVEIKGWKIPKSWLISLNREDKLKRILNF